jgi:hypothetical protein
MTDSDTPVVSVVTVVLIRVVSVLAEEPDTQNLIDYRNVH